MQHHSQTAEPLAAKWACVCCKYKANQPHHGQTSSRYKPPADSRQWEPSCQRQSAKAAQPSWQPDHHLPPALCPALVPFAPFTHSDFGYLPLALTGTLQRAQGCLCAPATRRPSHGGPLSILVKEPIQVNSDSIFPPLLDKQNREMPLTRKPSSNHLVFASHSLPVTVETTPLPPTCCQCLDCSYLLLIELASPLLFCYPIQSTKFCKHLAGVTKSDGEIIISTTSVASVPNWPSKHRQVAVRFMGCPQQLGNTTDLLPGN